MELDNVDVLIGMIIASIIIGIGLSMFFISYSTDGAVVLAIGMMTFALMITARPRVIERVKREIVLQPSKDTDWESDEATTIHQKVKPQQTMAIGSSQRLSEENGEKEKKS